MQAVFSSIFYFAPIALYQGWLMVGYATLYTMAPVFSLVLDRDLNEDLALSYPELYKDLTKVRQRADIHRDFVLTRNRATVLGPSSILQDLFYLAHDQPLPRFAGLLPCIVPRAYISPGAAIMILSLVLFENEFLNIVAISFTALILNELIMVALEITIWYVRLPCHRASFLFFFSCEC